MKKKGTGYDGPMGKLGKRRVGFFVLGRRGRKRTALLRDMPSKEVSPAAENNMVQQSGMFSTTREIPDMLLFCGRSGNRYFCHFTSFIFLQGSPISLGKKITSYDAPAFVQRGRAKGKRRKGKRHPFIISPFFFLFREMISGQKGKKRKGKTF